MPTTLLLVAYHYPPENVIGAARPARFVRYLPNFGWNCQVLTAAPQPNVAPEQIRWVKDKTREMWESNGGAFEEISVVQRYTELVLRRFFFPGTLGLTWAREAPAAASRFPSLDGDPPAAVLSTFPPISSHLVGWQISRKLRVPWIADFRDPFIFASDKEEKRYLPNVAARTLEKRFIQHADAVILNTEATAEMYRKRYPKHAGKMSVIWNGFDPKEALGPLPIPPRPQRILSHVGNLYAGRNPVAVLESLERLRISGDGEVARWNIALVGTDLSSPEEKAVIDRCVAAGWTSRNGTRIPHAEALRITQESDGLLLLQPQSDVQVPAKLFEYIRIGRPILSLAPRNSPVEWILERSGIPHTNLYPDDPAQEIDRKIAAYLRGGSDAASPSEWFETNFNATFQCRQLAVLLNEVIKKTGAR